MRRLVVLACCAIACAVSAAPRKARYVVTPIAPQIYAVIYDAEVETDGNALIVIGDDGVVVVDSHTGATAARRTIAEIKALTSAPVTHLINTHWHGDHVVGNQAYKEVWPSVKIVAHPRTREEIFKQTYTAKAKRETIDSMSASAKTYEERLAAGTTSTGEPLTGERRERAEVVHAKLLEIIEDWKAIKPSPPTVLVKDKLVLNQGKRRIEVLFLGRGNTAGDVVVHLPEERIVATGDLVVAPTPFATEVYPTEWVTTLDRLMALDTRVAVPGHGPPMTDWSYAKQVQNALSTYIAGVKSARASGATLDQAIERVQLDDVRNGFLGAVEPRRRAFEDYFRVPLIKRIWEELERKHLS
jgi:glyoxylase-like metal-dependent hydrolase (beta-lactamase superfamily II)